MSLDIRLQEMIVEMHPTLTHKLGNLQGWLNSGKHEMIEILTALTKEEAKAELLQDKVLIAKLKAYCIDEVQPLISKAYADIENGKRILRDKDTTNANYLALVEDGIFDELYKHIEEVEAKLNKAAIAPMAASIKLTKHRKNYDKFLAIAYA